MANILFSSLTDRQHIAFNPATDVLIFDVPGLTAASLGVELEETLDGSISLDGPGKRIYLPRTVRISQLGTANFVFPEDGSVFILGDGLTSETLDKSGNQLEGTQGADQLNGFLGDDVLSGGSGDDTLIGGHGNDVYMIDRASGSDTIIDMAGIGLADGNIDAIVYGDTIAPSDIVVTRTQWSLYFGIRGTDIETRISHYYYYRQSHLDEVRFADGTVWQNLGDNVQLIESSEGNDTLWGSSAADTIHALGGNDIVYGNEGDDQLNGDDGDDWLIGGLGNDILSGGAGNDVYLIDLDSGQDTIHEDAGNAGDVDSIYYDSGIAPSSIVVTRDHRNLYLSIRGTDTKTTIAGYFPIGFGLADDHLDEVHFADGRVFHNLFDYVKPAESSDGDDALYGSTHADTVNAGGGNDIVYGFEGYDRLNGGDGNDWLYGHFGNDTLSGDAGNDYLDGGSGDDTYVFDRGYGKDVASEDSSRTGGFDTIQLGEDILPSDITLIHSGYDLVLSINGTKDRLTLQHHFILEEIERIDAIRFSDGTVWNIQEHLPPAITEGDDVIFGTSLAETIDGLGGNDLIVGNDGNDVLHGGAGNDEIYGGDGADVLSGDEGADRMQGRGGDDLYVVDNPDDRVVERSYWSWGIDSVQSSVSYTLSRGIENLALTGSAPIDGTGNQLDNRISGNAGNNVLNGGEGNDILKGEDGRDTLNGGDGSDALHGGSGSDSLRGGQGHDTLEGGKGDDTLDGNTGKDLLQGGTGNDNYVLGLGYGSDTISENDSTAGNTDVASFREGIATDQLWFRHVGNNLEVSVIGTDDRFKIEDWFSGGAYRVEEFRTADGHLLLDDNVENLVQAMAAFAPPAAGQTTLPPAYAAALAPVIAANWQ